MTRAHRDADGWRKTAVRDALTAAGLAASVLGALAALSAAIVIGASPEPRFCATCHAKEAAGLAAGAHEGERCDACHAGAGILVLVEQRLTVVQMVASAASGASGPQAPVGDAACLVCHEADVDDTVVARGLRMSHREVSDAGIRCAECHADAIHGTRGRASRGRYDMGTCLECHRTNARDIDTCATCHVADASEARSRGVTPWRVTHGANWRRTHGMGDLRSCIACHTQQYCSRCHRTEVPHPSTFRSRHGRAVAADATLREDCLTCHREGSCDGCHGIEMPHRAGYLRSHQADAKERGDTVCYRCHDELSCKGCHDRHVHPGIPEPQLKKLLENPVTR